MCADGGALKGSQGSYPSHFFLSDCSPHSLLIHSSIPALFNPSLNQCLPDLLAGTCPHSRHSSALTGPLDHHLSHRRPSSPLSSLSYLADVHAGVTAQWPYGSQIVGPQQGGDDAVLVHLTDHGGVHEVHQPIFIHCDTCQREDAHHE